jgi:hypothetical protein
MKITMAAHRAESKKGVQESQKEEEAKAEKKWELERKRKENQQLPP